MFKTCDETEDVLFIDASSRFKKGRNQVSLSDDPVDEIVDAFSTRPETEHFSHIPNRAEIEENVWKLSIPQYVDVSQEVEEIDLGATSQAQRSLREDMFQILKERLDQAIAPFSNKDAKEKVPTELYPVHVDRFNAAAVPSRMW